MRTTISLDDELVQRAQAYTGLRGKSDLLREALRALIARESARRVAWLGEATLIWHQRRDAGSITSDPGR